MVPNPGQAPVRFATLTASAAIRPTVAVVRSDNRRGAVAEALALLAEPIRAVLASPVVVQVRLGTGRSASTAPASLSAVLDVVLAGESREVVVASGASRASDRFERFGFGRECWGRPVRFLDLDWDETAWVPADGADPASPRLSSALVGAGCRIAMTPTPALRGRRGGLSHRLAIADAIHPDDRVIPWLSTPAEPVPAMRRVWPDLSLIEGPIERRGRRVVAIAGTDAVAVDAIAARVLGLGDRWAWLPGAVAADQDIGMSDILDIDVVGDAVEPVRRRRWWGGGTLRLDRPGRSASGRHNTTEASSRDRAGGAC